VKHRSPRFECPCSDERPSRWIRHGSFYRASDSRWISRWKCAYCGKTLSQASGHPCFRQHKRRVNITLFNLLCSGTSLRRAARLLRVHRTTVVRKFRFLAEQCRKDHAAFLAQFKDNPLNEIIFDEMETFEHTKHKPLSIPLAVTASRQILSFDVARMPAKGPLAAKSRKKYGVREDERPAAISKVLCNLLPITQTDATFKSDQNPSYPNYLFKAFPNAKHETTKGGRSCVVGQGELKKLGWDPLFSLNHTAAMMRANMNRLFRRTWCTTKTVQGLRDHIALYVRYHNHVLLAQPASR
jgi:transposase-like protein